MVKFHSLRAQSLQTLTQQLFATAGAPTHIAEIVAEILVDSNLAGHDSHGVLRVPWYLKQIEEKKLNPAAEPIIVKEEPNRLLLDGNNGFGHYTAHCAMEMAIAKSKREKICCVNFTQIQHIGRVGEYAEDAARAGCLGLITVGYGAKNHPGRVAPYGGMTSVLGTNPIAIGVPTGDTVPFIIDFATSVVAEGKLQVARSKGLDVAEGTIIDKAGKSTVKPDEFYDGGALLTFGKHKGYALSLFVCLLGGLSGQFEPVNAGMGGAFMQVMDIEAFTPLATYQKNVRAFLDGIKSAPVGHGFEEILAPGDFEQRSRAQRLTNGIEIPDPIYIQLQSWAEKLDVPFVEA